MSRTINWTLLALALFVGTGAYVMFPPAMYALVGAIGIAYAGFALREKSATSLLSNIIFLAYVVFLLSNYLRDLDAPAPVSRLYVNFFLGIAVYCMVIRVFQLNSGSDVKAFRYLPLASILVLLLGILLELNGVIVSDERDIGIGIEAALLRPGGFLNPNITAALGLIWLFIALEARPANRLWLKAACLAGGGLIIAVTQSRGAMLFLAIYFLYKLFERGGRVFNYFLFSLPILAALYVYSDISGVAADLYDANATRLQGDDSSQERFLLLKTAFSAFLSNPVFGGGMREMRNYFGSGSSNLIPGSHNEIVEWLVNFGILGFCVMLLILFRFYYAGSFKHLALCILPSFLFSHNFFETTALQVALAYAFYLGTQASRQPIVRRIVMPVVAYGSVTRRAPAPRPRSTGTLVTERIKVASGARQKGIAPTPVFENRTEIDNNW